MRNVEVRTWSGSVMRRAMACRSFDNGTIASSRETMAAGANRAAVPPSGLRRLRERPQYPCAHAPPGPSLDLPQVDVGLARHATASGDALPDSASACLSGGFPCSSALGQHWRPQPAPANPCVTSTGVVPGGRGILRLPSLSAAPALTRFAWPSRAYEFLAFHLLPHAQAEDAALYPQCRRSSAAPRLPAP